MIDSDVQKAMQAQKALQEIHIPRLMRKAPVIAQAISGVDSEGSPSVVLMLSSVNGDLGFLLDPDVAAGIGENLLAAARQAKSGIITP